MARGWAIVGPVSRCIAAGEPLRKLCVSLYSFKLSLLRLAHSCPCLGWLIASTCSESCVDVGL